MSCWGRIPLAAILALGVTSSVAQTPPSGTAVQNRLIGAVTAVDAAGKKIALTTDAGGEATVLLQDATGYLRVPPGERDLKKATEIRLSDIAAGDRVLARGRAGDDGKSLMATSVIVMTKTDIARKQAADRLEWQRRGVAGLIMEVNAPAREVTIRTRTPEGMKPLRIRLASSASLRRYAPDSVKFADAKPSTFSELKIGDQVRALGERSADGTALSAEEMVSGSFRNIAATVISVDAAGKSVKITDLDTKKPVAVHVNADSNLRRMPPFAAQMIAARNSGGAPDGAPGGGGAGGGPPGARPAGGAGPGGPGGGMMGRGGPPDIQQMLERMPPFTLAELKPGDALIIAGTNSADSNQVTAITILAGVEPILTATPQGDRQLLMGSWNLNMNVGEQ